MFTVAAHRHNTARDTRVVGRRPGELNLKNWTLRQRILASFAVIIAIMVWTVVAVFGRLQLIDNGMSNFQANIMPGVYYSTMVRSSWVDNYVTTIRITSLNQNGVIDARDIAELRDYEKYLAERIAEFENTITDEADRKEFAQFLALRDRYTTEHQQVLALYKQGQTEQAHRHLAETLRPLWSEGREVLTDIVQRNRDKATDAKDGVMAAVQSAKIGMLGSVLLAILVAVLSGLLLMRAIMGPTQRIVEALGALRGGNLAARLALDRKDEFGAIESGFNSMASELTGLVAQAQRSSVQVTTAVTEIAATTRQQEATATETAAATTQIGATSREIAATSRDLVRTMNEVSGAAEQTSTLAGSGQLGLSRMEETMHQVMSAADLVNGKLATLNERAGNINKMVTTIVKVADQTNLLSLNAAIEAEKAGEYGKGFAVVATEVRRLADQTAVATYDIEQMVREIQSAVSAGVMGMDKFSEEVRRGMAEVQQVGEQLSQIIQQVQALAPRVQMVNEGMQAQSTGAEQINQALTQLGEATGQTVESLRQTSAAIDELNQVANGLRSGVSRFKV